jgi:hypothetical protein
VRFLGTGHQTIPFSKILLRSNFELLSEFKAGKFKLASNEIPSLNKINNLYYKNTEK